MAKKKERPATAGIEFKPGHDYRVEFKHGGAGEYHGAALTQGPLPFDLADVARVFEIGDVLSAIAPPVEPDEKGDPTE